jgi:hypothetical protein
MPNRDLDRLARLPANSLEIGDPVTAAEVAYASRVKTSIRNIVQFRQAFRRRADELAGALERFKERRRNNGLK